MYVHLCREGKGMGGYGACCGGRPLLPPPSQPGNQAGGKLASQAASELDSEPASW